jgi:hypothetical protein
VPLFTVTIPGLNPSYVSDTFGISQGNMRFTSADLQTLFDIQMHRLYDLIDSQINSFMAKYPAEQITHLVLSGGLGNNSYIQKSVIDRYSFGASGLSAVRNVKVSVAGDPQLAVCKGIVADRIRRLNSGKAVLGWRCCRASYGTICKIPYDKKNPDHVGRPVSRDPFNGNDYITNAVAWFIKKVGHQDSSLLQFSSCNAGRTRQCRHTDMSYFYSKAYPWRSSTSISNKRGH